MINNNHGWGLKEMLFFSAIIFFFMILAVVLINNMYQGLTSELPSSKTAEKKYTYKDIEMNLKSAAKKYVIKTKDTSNLIISDELISENYLTQKQMQTDDDECSGYVLVEENYQPYITCNHYETQGY